MANTHLSVPVVTHSGRRGKGLSLVYGLMPPSHREVGDGHVPPMHRGELVEIHRSVQQTNSLTHKLSIGGQLTVIGWGEKKSGCSGRTTTPTRCGVDLVRKTMRELAWGAVLC